MVHLQKQACTLWDDSGVKKLTNALRKSEKKKEGEGSG